jgi:hypothetical protein
MQYATVDVNAELLVLKDKLSYSLLQVLVLDRIRYSRIDILNSIRCWTGISCQFKIN